MKGTPRLARMLVLAVFAILGSTWGVARAHAETIGMFTGSWTMQTYDSVAFGQHQSIYGLEGPIGSTVTGRVSFNGSISDYSEQGSGCTVLPEPGFCEATWSGVFSGGVVSFDAWNSQFGGPQYVFTGTIIGGSFSGLRGCDNQECMWTNDAMFSFVSTSTMFAPPPPLFPVLNGWSSEGTFSVTSSPGYSVGTLTMTTTSVPEPGSMALLGAGIGAVATLRRRRRSRVVVA